MATKHFCDNCAVELNDKNTFYGQTINPKRDGKKTSFELGVTNPGGHDLCSKCVAEMVVQALVPLESLLPKGEKP